MFDFQDELDTEDVSLCEIFFSDGSEEESDGLIWKEILREGEWAYRPGATGKPTPIPLKVVAGSAKEKGQIGMKDLVEAFNEGAVDHVTVPTSHDDKPHENTGFVRKLQIKSKGGKSYLAAGIEFTEPDIEEKTKRRSIANTSAGIMFDYIKKESGKVFKQVLGHVALTNKPWINGMKPFGVAASENFDESEIIGVTLADVVWDANTSFAGLKSNIQNALGDEFGVVDLAKDKALVQKLDGETYVVPFTNTKKDGFSVSPHDNWIPASREWVETSLAELDVELRDFSAEKRRQLAKEGKALPDGSYPIVNLEDLRNAIQAFGRAPESKRSAVRRHIIKRARSLGATNVLPDSWNVRLEDEASSRGASQSDPEEGGSLNMGSEVKNRETDSGATSGDPAPDQAQNDNGKVVLTEEALEDLRTEFGEKNEELLGENEKLRQRIHNMQVKERVEELKSIGFGEFPGLLAEIETLLSADDGKPALVLSETKDEETKEVSLSASEIVERIISKLPRDNDNRLQMGEQSSVIENHSAPPSEPEKEGTVEERAAAMAEQLGVNYPKDGEQ